MTPFTAFLGRQPIIDKQQQLIGYELLYRPDAIKDQNDCLTALEADTRMLSNLLGNIQQIDTLQEEKLNFINIGEEMLMSELVELLPAKKIRLELSAHLTPSREVLERMRYLRGKGFRFSLDHFVLDSRTEAFLDQVSYVKLDIQQLEPAAFVDAIARLKNYPIMRIAERVEIPAHFRVCRELALDGYQGFHFARPETLGASDIHPCLFNTLKLLNLVRANAEPAAIEAVLKTDLAISVKLLRFVNSAAAGLKIRVTSFSHAITVLGYRRLYRWLTLLLITNSVDHYIPPALQKTAVVRARLLENLGRSRRAAVDACDLLFICGMFSLLDVILGVPMPEIARQLSLPQEVEAALYGDPGEGSYLLALARSLETTDMQETARLAQMLGISAEELNTQHSEAIGWAETLGL